MLGNRKANFEERYATDHGAACKVQEAASVSLLDVGDQECVCSVEVWSRFKANLVADFQESSLCADVVVSDFKRSIGGQSVVVDLLAKLSW